MNKKLLRVEYISKRIALSDEEFNQRNSLIVTKFLQEFWALEVNVVHSYLPILSKREVNTWPVIEWFRDKGSTVVVPKTNFRNSKMEHFVLDSDTILVENNWGIKEPAEGEKIQPFQIDAVIAPLLIFDVAGQRVGYGKGFYDRFFSECDEEVIKIGLCLFPPVELIDDLDQYDFPLDYVITPDQVYQF